MRLPRRGAFGTKSQDIPSISSNNDVPERFVRSSVPLWSLFPDDNPRCSGAQIFSKTVSANGTLSCALSRSYAARNGVMPPAPRARLATQNPAYLTIHGQITESSVIRVLQRFCVSYRRVLSCSPIVRLLVLRGRCSLSCVAVLFPPPLCGAFSLSLFSASAMIEGSLSQRETLWNTLGRLYGRTL